VADLGDPIPLAVEIRDAAGVLANAGAMTLTITLPDGTAVTPSVTNPSVGRYEYNYVPTLPGRYVARWVATGLNSSAYVDTFDVRPADPGYIVSLADAKRALNMDLTDTSNDEELRSMIEAITGVVEEIRDETIVRRTFVERIYPHGQRRWLLKHHPVLTLTSVVREVDVYTWAPSDVTITDAAIGEIGAGLYAPWLYGELTVTYVVGWSAVPAQYVEAAKIILRHLFSVQRISAFGSRASGDDTTVVAGFAIPNRAIELLGGRAPLLA
jgi:hypothetical protein